MRECQVESLRPFFAQASATVALACLFLNGFTEKKDWQPEDFYGTKRKAKPEPQEVPWQDQKAAFMWFTEMTGGTVPDSARQGHISAGGSGSDGGGD